MVKNSSANAGDTGSIPGLGKSPGEGAWQPTPVFFPGKSHGQRSLTGYSPWGRKKSDMNERPSISIYITDSLCCPSETNMTL